MDTQQESIIKHSNEILDYLLKFKESHPAFTFSLRQRDFAKTDGVQRLGAGQWFQGSDYIYVPLFKKGDSARKIKTLGFTIEFDKAGNITTSSITISFKSGIQNENEITFHRRLASKIGLELNEQSFGDKYFENPQDVHSNLTYFITEVRNYALTLLEELELGKEYIYSESDFQKYLTKINEIKVGLLTPKSDLNYWVFQGSPTIFDMVGALEANAIRTWTVSSHKSKIVVGDKIILWLTGTKSGCYALGKVASPVTNMKEEETEMHFYLNPTKQVDNDRVSIEIEHNYFNNPVLWETIKDDKVFNDFKGGSQGTNFTSNKEQYETIIDLVNSNKVGAYSAVKKVLDPKKLKSFLEILRDFVKENGTLPYDERISFNVRKNKNRLVFLIGNRYSLCIEKKQNKTALSFISKDAFNEESEIFNNHKGEIDAYWNFVDNLEEYKSQINESFLIQLDRFNKCPARKYTNQDFINDVYQIKQSAMENMKPISTFPLNQILYGPPGTGKTYNTILEAAKILTGNENIDYTDALKVFNDNLNNQIEFITFHQNYSYEDFIQGIRPDTENGKELSFEKKDGVFKRIADRALENINSSKKQPEELINEALFDRALEEFKESVLDSEDNFKINETAYIFETEKDAFRYTGEKWGYVNGLRMKFVDLKEFYRNNVHSRKDVKSLTSISGLAKQHATYYYLVYEQILKHIPKKLEEQIKIERKNYVIIIDEINRANISRVFGELITLIEEDKRSDGDIPLRVTLPSGDPFMVPSNLYIIGTMNTADKSIALLDIALRRRFEFIPMYPLYEGLEKPIHDAELLNKINDAVLIRKNHDFTIGHAYFMGNEYSLQNTLNKKVIPLLLEYFMNDEKEVMAILQAAGIKIGGWPLKMIW
ncbi:McrB family protein [Flavobacterium sp. W22_SRS_FP1]|uniref:McrB family protein n=1 Tax=Flavobacterium sp. W22_SRS_FP1 TaxID=3240276 RepID=UPI003F936237